MEHSLDALPLFFFFFFPLYYGINLLAPEILLSDVSVLGQASALRCRELTVTVFSQQVQKDSSLYI